MAARPPYPGTPPPPGAPPVAPQRYGAPQGAQGTPMRYPQQSYPVSGQCKACVLQRVEVRQGALAQCVCCGARLWCGVAAMWDSARTGRISVVGGCGRRSSHRLGRR
ncbi:hypothetical protein E2C01_076883 [Portunus trituberculatus]|uniref:Uncharacterized protein n=1 Tax=Portunus trituberculatus TaxID=210409 RepID=A0A5B7I9X4_PORTR|nr:hypothetical protein [Portunus trituberculatus]